MFQNINHEIRIPNKLQNKLVKFINDTGWKDVKEMDMEIDRLTVETRFMVQKVQLLNEIINDIKRCEMRGEAIPEAVTAKMKTVLG